MVSSKGKSIPLIKRKVNNIMSKPLTKREAFRLQTVLLVATTNPKKKPSMSYDRFECYFDIDWSKEQTVQDCLDAGVRMDDIRHDSEHGFILLGEEAIADYKAKQAQAKVDALEAARALIAAAEAEAENEEENEEA